MLVKEVFLKTLKPTKMNIEHLLIETEDKDTLIAEIDRNAANGYKVISFNPVHDPKYGMKYFALMVSHGSYTQNLDVQIYDKLESIEGYLSNIENNTNN